VYDGDGVLVAKSGLIDFDEWYRHAFGKHSPWGDEDSPALATAVESALERDLSSLVMRGASKPDIKKLKPGKVLMEQGSEGDRLALVLDGVVAVQVNGEPLAELGPGAVVGERAVLEGGKRTATVAAVTRCTVATIPAAAVDRDALERLAEGHHREDG
jgi:CRP-like cAMP-binding protein